MAELKSERRESVPAVSTVPDIETAPVVPDAVSIAAIERQIAYGKRTDVVLEQWSRSFTANPDHAVRHFPPLPDSAEVAGTLYTQRALQEVVRADPDHVVAWKKLADTHEYFGEREAELECLGNVHRLSPESTETLARIAGVCLQLGRTEEALRHIEGARQLAPDDPEILIKRGMVLEAANQPEAAFDSYRAAAVINPTYVRAWQSMLHLGSALGRQDDALRVAEVLVVLEPNNPSAWSNKGALLTKADRLREASEAYKKAHELDPESATLCVLYTTSALRGL